MYTCVFHVALENVSQEIRLCTPLASLFHTRRGLLLQSSPQFSRISFAAIVLTSSTYPSNEPWTCPTPPRLP